MKECVIISHLGLGDLILISGLAVHLAERYDVVRFPCRTQDQNSVYSFFFLQPKIKIYSFNADSTTPKQYPIHHSERNPDFVRLGFYSDLPMDKSISFSENFYRQAGVDYAVRWDKCPIQKVVDKFYLASWQLTPDLYFMHDDNDRKFWIDWSRMHVLDPFHVSKNSSSILAHAPIMRVSEQIHVIDGPFLHLAESIETTGELYYHKYSRPLSARWNNCDVPTRKKWHILE